MRSKEHILDDSCTKHGTFLYVSGINRVIDGDAGAALAAMDEFAKETAIEYAHWLLKRMGVWHVEGEKPETKVPELYNLFLQSINK